jgi:hypothetical protein
MRLFVRGIALGSLSLSLATNGCSGGSASEMPPEIDVDNTDPSAAHTYNGWTIDSQTPVLTSSSSLRSQINLTGPPGTTNAGGCMLWKVPNQPPCIDINHATQGCPAVPAWAADPAVPTQQRYCIAPHGSATKNCYVRPGKHSAYCAGSPVNLDEPAPGNAPVPVSAASSPLVTPKRAAFPYIDGKRASTATWLTNGCITGCSPFPANGGSRSQELTVTAWARDFRNTATIGFADGTVDLIGRDPLTNQLVVFAGNGTGGLVDKTGIVVKSTWFSTSQAMSPGDFDGDGHSDVLEFDTTTANVRLWKGDGAGHLAATSTFVGNLPNVSRLIPVGDWDLDGNNDVMVINTSTVPPRLLLHRGNGAGGFVTPAAIVSSWWDTTWRPIPVGDWNKDGTPDIMVKDSGGLMSLCKGPKGAAVEFEVGACGGTIGTGWNIADAITGVGDIDGDGNPDLLARVPADNATYIYTGNGVNGFTYARYLLGASGVLNRTTTLESIY